MDVIGEFIELKDQVDGRLLKIEELLQRLKPELDDRTQIDPVINQRGVFGLLLICFSLSYINP